MKFTLINFLCSLQTNELYKWSILSFIQPLFPVHHIGILLFQTCRQTNFHRKKHEWTLAFLGWNVIQILKGPVALRICPTAVKSSTSCLLEFNVLVNLIARRFYFRLCLCVCLYCSLLLLVLTGLKYNCKSLKILIKVQRNFRDGIFSKMNIKRVSITYILTLVITKLNYRSTTKYRTCICV